MVGGSPLDLDISGNEESQLFSAKFYFPNSKFDYGLKLFLPISILKSSAQKPRLDTFTYLFRYHQWLPST